MRMNTNNINKIITDLYEALVLVRYPGIAKIDLSNLEDTVLAENNRNELLYWLLVQSINVVDLTLDTPTSDEKTLLKWYYQFGVCTNKDALLGRCPLIEQSETLVNLTEFIVNVIGVDGNKAPVSSDFNRNTLQSYIDNEINILPTSFDLAKCNMTYKEALQYIKQKNSSLKDRDNNINGNSDWIINDSQSQNKKLDYDNGNNSDNVEDVDVKINDSPTNPVILNEFYETFRSMEMSNNSEIQQLENNTKMDKCIQNIHEKFSTLNETLRCKTEICNAVIPVKLNIEDSPLNQIIQEAVIGLENLSKLYNTGDEENII